MAAMLSGGSAGLPPCCCCGTDKRIQGRAETCTDWLIASRHLRVDSLLSGTLPKRRRLCVMYPVSAAVAFQLFRLVPIYDQA